MHPEEWLFFSVIRLKLLRNMEHMEQYGGGANSKQQKYFNRIDDISFPLLIIVYLMWRKQSDNLLMGYETSKLVDIVSMLQTVERTCML